MFFSGYFPTPPHPPPLFNYPFPFLPAKTRAEGEGSSDSQFDCLFLYIVQNNIYPTPLRPSPLRNLFGSTGSRMSTAYPAH